MVTNPLRAFQMAFLTFTISLVISLLLQFALALWLSVLMLLMIVIIGIIFDIIGTAVTAATEAPFHAMGADKIKGSRQAIFLIRNADQVANFCNDVIGDIAGTLSGALIAGIVLQFVRNHDFLSLDLFNATAIAFLAAITVLGKAMGKSLAITNAHEIVFTVGKILSVFKLANFDPKKGKRKGKSGQRKMRKS